ncbi:hypothetical protein PFFVO_05989, partial [Plasmodium falciparum Vietnam Oak-Knoll (FVO)]
MARGGGGGSTQDEDAKHMFDRIGAEVQKIATRKALDYIKDLQGDLGKVKFFKGDTVTNKNACLFDHTKDTNVTSGQNNENPCHGRQSVRFSDTQGAECYRTRIKGSEKNSGACAPFRKLHMCDRNLEHIEPHQITSTHNLLVDVLLAAKHEGQMITKNLKEYDATNYASRICTELARSFADIGDIIRGKDLFLGHNQRKKKLEENLKNLFKNLYKELTKDKKNGAEELQKRYENDGPNYYQLREDWWNANRYDVWKAMTCKAEGAYFHATCGGGKTPTDDKCHCIGGTVPTYFDYVPQYLRWFEEWAEDFCRKRKHKLENAIKNCRGEKGNERYCSRNGYDCINTVRIQGKLVKGSECDDCYSSCTPFVKWIDDKKQEFLKQKKKYANEINGSNENTEKKTKHGPINNLYVKDFYDILKVQYEKVNKFLELLSKEQICQSEPQVEQGKASLVKFTEDNDDKTFSHTEYCEPCPWCGLKHKEDGTWERKEENHPDCPQKEEKIFNIENTTDIPVLTPQKGKTSILQKYRNFCQNPQNNKQIKKWTCHYENTHNDDCVLHDGKKGTSKETIMSYHPFFWKWVTEMLDDSIEWRRELKSCIDKDKSGQCIKLCHWKCDCFAKWVKQKKNEFIEIKEHFKKQKDIGQKGVPIVFTHDDVLEGVLQSGELFKNIEKDYGNAEEIKHIKEIMDNKNRQETTGGGTQNKTTIDKLLNHEEGIAKECQQKQNDCNKQSPPTDRSPARSAEEGPGRNLPSPQTPSPPPEEEEDGDEDEEEEEEKEEEERAKETTQITKEDEVKPCDIVETLFTNGDTTALQDACKIKYDGKYYGWRCVAPSGPTSDGSGDTTKSSDSGSICVPPRRRRLYVGKLKEWAEKQVGEAAQGKGASSTSSHTDATQLLRQAFIESAAVETFFLWHKYKMDKEIEKKQQQENGGLVLDTSTVDEKPQEELQSGKIPDDFLRQMFYTLGDYRDICVGVKQDVIEALKKSGDNKSGDKNINDISDKIKEILNGDNKQQPRKENSVKDPKEWWNKHAESIWNGMICALTYEDKSEIEAKPTEGEKTNTPKITQNTQLKNALLDTEGKKPKTKTDGTHDYTYEKVVLKEEVNGAKSASASGENTPLTQFVKRPPYFRYLEEWGETFCVTRKRMLKNVKDNCLKSDGERCSGDGENCDDNLRGDPSTVPTFYCTSCGKSCGFYKKWIKTKKDEFTKQGNAYNEQREKAESNTGNIYDEKFVEKLRSDYKSIDSFLNSLKKGPCKTNNENNKGEDEIKFDDKEKTFGHETYCDPCSEFKVKCNGRVCNGDGTKVECNGTNKNSISANHIIDDKNGNGNIEMLVSDNSPNGFNGLEDCENAHIFKGIRKEQWTCGKVCGYNVCKPKNGNGKKGNGNQIIIIRALFKRWLEYFLEDYNKIKKKLKPCMNSGEGSKCIKDYEKKYKCVKQWIEKKKTEWGKIKEHYLEKNKEGDTEMISLVRTFLEELQPQTDVNKAIKPCKSLDKFETSCGLNGPKPSEKGEHKINDVIDCMLNKLQNKIHDCNKNHTQNSVETEKPCQESPSVEDEDDTLHKEIEVKAPEICKDVVQEAEPEEPGETCTPAAGGKENPEETPVLKPEEEAVPEPPQPPQEKAPAPAPHPQPPPPLPSDNTSDILKTTIPFGIALALTSIVFLFLK